MRKYVALALSTLSIGCTLEKLCQDLDVVLKKSEQENDDVDLIRVNSTEAISDGELVKDDNIPLALFFRDNKLRYHKAGYFSEEHLNAAIELLRPKKLKEESGGCCSHDGCC